MRHFKIDHGRIRQLIAQDLSVQTIADRTGASYATVRKLYWAEKNNRYDTIIKPRCKVPTA